ncbi:MAG: hypothetical protein COU07_02565 [Candidatus Harrisonbacteria bacterium CG10_big_fil_rev_8_21_14_0_10_40_38]|uniref:histidine kinase n=1 Tax=Candidatus Harrisonbacteria bacterium CG10_big_fil_rev_8_21_14_0_10_40_38 TaxID=1974583 RepID=A0A2H0URP7_9BACT|nr:MAG: hypothetical protein COU07_02565 [Candidatus Harrisonbacteria bacterium CG10_big_fil_rev_8_21_14_0_10_40_38]
MQVVRNLDLFSVGVAIAAIAILGFVAFLNNKKSITNKTFFAFSMVAVLWNVANYLIFQFDSPEIALWILRSVIFFATWYCFFIFQLFFVAPEEQYQFPKIYKFGLIPIVIAVSLLTLTPYVFKEVTAFDAGKISSVENGPGIFIFGALVISLLVGGTSILIHKMRNSEGIVKTHLKYIYRGAIATFLLYIVFNFILPAFFNNPSAIPLGALFTFPIVMMTTYAIFKHHLFNVKIIATESLAFFLAIVTLYETVFAENLTIIILRSGVFLLVLAFSILLIRSVRREVEQREKLEVLTQQLETTNVKLQKLDQLKSAFLSFAAHQAKGPINNVKGYASLIEDGSFGEVPQEVKEKALRIKTIADDTLILLGNLLDMRKIEEGTFFKEFKYEEVNIVDFVQKLIEEYKVGMTLRGKPDLELSFESSAPEIKIKIDQLKIRQVVQNLLDNAIKYTDKGFVKVSVADEQSANPMQKNTNQSPVANGYVLITIQDSGRGISKDLQEKLFHEFVRDEKTSKEIQGTGLGLYLAKQIVDAHKGQITAASEGEGKGSTFTVKLGKI